MWYFVTIKFDEEHQNTTTVNASAEQSAIDIILAEYNMKRSDVLSALASLSTTMNPKKTRVHYAKGIEPK